LLAPLRNAEHEINRAYSLDLTISAHNFGAPLDENEWRVVGSDLRQSEVVFVIHVMDGENAAKLISLLEKCKATHNAVVVINCMPELMRRTRMGKLDIAKYSGRSASEGEKGKATALLSAVASWVGNQAKGKDLNKRKNGHGHYLKLADRLPGILRFIPTAGTLRDVKHYLYLFCYFLQPTPDNIRSMVLYALKCYVPDERLRRLKLKVPQPESMPSVAVYHPDAPQLFQSFDDYEKWYLARAKSKARRSGKSVLHPDKTIGLLLMRPQVVSKTTQHYDTLIRALESEGLSVVPAISTLMDNREASENFFLKPPDDNKVSDRARVSQILSLTGFSFVGGPAMNDRQAASEFLTDLNRPYRSAVSLDMQTIEAWEESQIGLNPVQAGMQIAIPEIDGATEPFVYGGLPGRGVEPVALEERCRRLARRIARWNRLRTASRDQLKIAMVLFCFPPNRGNVGTAADLDVFPSVWDTLRRMSDDGYVVDLPSSVDELRERVIGAGTNPFGGTANVAHRMTVDEYRACCHYVDEIEKEWGPAPGRINSHGGELLIQGVQLGNIFIGIQPTFGYEGDPMRLMMARGSSPHHGFMAFYTFLSKVLDVDAVVHVGTHGAMEFMPGKQLGLSGECWPDRLIGDLPNIYLYSVNNPSEGSIAKRRSYAELISYLTPPIENAGLYKDFAALKDLLNNYRQTADETERERLFASIEQLSEGLHLADVMPTQHILEEKPAS
jgi:magnesium chelatase subunit H